MLNKIEIYKKLLTSLRSGQTIRTACDVAGLNPVTLWKWRKLNPRLDEAIENIRESRTHMVEDALFDSALSGDVKAQIFYLKNRGKNWKETALVDQSVKTITKIYAWGNSESTDKLCTAAISENSSRLDSEISDS